MLAGDPREQKGTKRLAGSEVPTDPKVQELESRSNSTP